jgi:hypothetical protein
MSAVNGAIVSDAPLGGMGGYAGPFAVDPFTGAAFTVLLINRLVTLALWGSLLKPLSHNGSHCACYLLPLQFCQSAGICQPSDRRCGALWPTILGPVDRVRLQCNDIFL